MRTVSRRIHAVRYRFERGHDVVINRIDLTPATRHFDRIRNQSLIKQIAPLGDVIAMPHPVSRRGGISSGQPEPSHDVLNGMHFSFDAAGRPLVHQ